MHERQLHCIQLQPFFRVMLYLLDQQQTSVNAHTSVQETAEMQDQDQKAKIKPKRFHAKVDRIKEKSPKKVIFRGLHIEMRICKPSTFLCYKLAQGVGYP